MNELDFKMWLTQKGYSKKVQSDIVSRIKKIERLNGCRELEEEFIRDRGSELLSLFRNKGENENMQSLGEIDLPIGKYHLSTYKYAAALYFRYLQEI